MLQGVEYTAYTDHAALTRWLDNKPVNERHARWMSKVQHLIHDIQYVPGDLNVLADLMSRPRGLLRNNYQDDDEVQNAPATIDNAQYTEDEVHFVNAINALDVILHNNHVNEQDDGEDGISEEDEQQKILKPTDELTMFKIRQYNRRQSNEQQKIYDRPSGRKTLNEVLYPNGEQPKINEKTKQIVKPEFPRTDFVLTPKAPKLTKREKRQLQRAQKDKEIKEIEQWPDFKKTEGCLPADQYEEISDDELDWHKKIIKYQGMDFLKGQDVDFAQLHIIGDLVYISGDHLSNRPYGKILLPPELRTQAIKAIHEVGHYGQRKTRNKVALEYFWKGMSRDVYNYVRACRKMPKK